MYVCLISVLINILFEYNLCVKESILFSLCIICPPEMWDKTNNGDLLNFNCITSIGLLFTMKMI